MIKLFSGIGRKFDVVRNRLTRIHNTEPLGFISLALIIFLDLFILSNLFQGLENQTRPLTSPDEYVPYVCRSILIEEDWVEENKVGVLASIVLYDYRSTYYIDPLSGKLHPVCKDLMELLEKIKKDTALINLFKQYDSIGKNYNSFDLHEKSVNAQADQYLKEMSAVANQINGNEVVKQFWSLIQDKSKLSQTLISDLRRANFIYPIKKLAVEFLFLMPMLVIVLMWNAYALKRDKSLQVLISSHLTVVTFIPVFFELCSAIYDIIPKHLLKRLFDLLEQFNLIAIWHYLISFLAVGVTLLLIYFFQTKLFDKKRLMIKRLSKSQCVSCSKRLYSDVLFCPFCGEDQYRPCPRCRRETYVGAECCINCGASINR